MTSNEERRKVAERLRQMADAHYAVEASRVARALGLEYEVHGTVVAFNGAAAQALADLIDRPTATASMDYEAMEDGVPDCRIWTCHRCNESFPVYRGFSPAYCQNCGAEVVDA